MSVLHHGDCLEVMAAMDAGSVDAVVTDPPYGLGFMGKDWDDGARRASFTEANTRLNKYPKTGKGPSAVAFNGPVWQAWCEEWATEALRVLKPSHYLLAFGGTRTWHRLACAIEDAGFEIRDTLMWLYGSGFPKGTACLKPAWEPIILARKPGPKRALGIEECRIGFSGDADEREAKDKNRHADFGSGPRDNQVLGADNRDRASQGNYDSPGRYPANLILDEEAGAMLDGQTGTLTSGAFDQASRTAENQKYGEFHGYADPKQYADSSGGASRFFYCAKASRSERNAGCEGMEERRGGGLSGTHDGSMLTGSGNERNPMAANHHPTIKPLTLMRWLVKLVAYPGDTVLDPFMGSGTTGVACAMEGRKFIGIEREVEYIEIARRRIEAASAQERLPI